MNEMEQNQSVLETAQVLNSKASGVGYLEEGMGPLCLQAASEGIVLLENDGTLPLKDCTVSVFGRVQFDYIYVGYGSGGNVLAPYFINAIEGLRQTGRIRLNEKLCAQYESWCKAHAIPQYEWAKWPYHYEEMPLKDDEIAQAAKESDVALVIIGRAAGEDRESLLEMGSYYLTEDEKSLLERVTKAFAKTVVVIDTGNVMDMSWIRDYRISSVVLAWQGGMESGRALANVLTAITPASGKLVDTIAYDFRDYPSSANFGDPDHNNYVEDIYVGYRYFETFAKDKVQYPFGYGLSYTTFKTEFGTFEEHNHHITVSAKVINAGKEYAGHETLQLYVQAPQGKLGKPLRSLCGFQKTDLLKPGKSQDICIKADWASLASYDDGGVTGNPSSYVLEPGTYIFYLGTDVRNAKECARVTLDDLVVVQTLSQHCAPEKQNAFKRLKPQVFCHADGTVCVSETYEDVPCSTVNRKQMILQSLPKECALTPSKGYVLKDVKDKKITLDEFVSQLDIQQLVDLCIGEGPMDSKLGIPGNTGTFGGYFDSAKEVGIPPIITTDGPAGMRVLSTATLFPCGTALASTWNPAIVQSMMTLSGKELSANGSDILLAPGLNIHRSPLCGRNFEYYSEDPLISGVMASAFVRGLQTHGLSACPKHFACNNQETLRTRNDSRVSERALREIYLKGFEIVVKTAKPRNLMTSYNKINGVWSHYNYELVTKILREEWGYDGCVMTDWWMRPATDPDFGDTNDAYRVRAQVDVLMPGGWKDVSDEHDSSLIDSYRKGIITLGEIQRSAKNVLGFALRKI